MRFPASVNISTYQAYRNLDSVEVDRVLKAENFEWDSEHPKSLATLCVERISTNWAGIPKLEELVPKDREYFLQILDTNVPLQLLVDNIKNDLFWERCYQSKWSELPESVRNKKWINIFVEKYYVDILENMIPREYDPEKVHDKRILIKYAN
ncbi:dynein regulatory complex subunit 5 [Leptidea sinapis]|uniref:dynein regulatory complex subunit 5 n=1 Tax=Leptidea sinapis TaxID=189913 RepID=UPI0021C42F9F|nr:dynein regulatory complex subunit 5 [Leptidea sinapis]